jgi:hypothetical protein
VLSAFRHTYCIFPQKRVLENLTDKGLFGHFSNYAGQVQVGGISYPLSYLQLSRPTGKHISRVALKLVNFIVRSHSIQSIGNTCAPGFVLLSPDPEKGITQFKLGQNQNIGSLIVNTPSHKPLKDAIIFEAEPIMMLPLQKSWLHFNDYVTSMQSKYRVRINKALDQSQTMTRKTLSGIEITETDLARCAAFLSGTLSEKTVAMHPDLKGILRAYTKFYGNDFSIHYYENSEGIYGFVSSLKLGEDLLALHIGYHASQAKELHLYQRMMLDLIKDGIQIQCSNVNFGRTATEIKSTLGAIPIENAFAVYIKNSFFRALVGLYKRLFFKPSEYILRSPFKMNPFNKIEKQTI